MDQEPKNFVQRYFDDRLDRLTETRIAQYTQKYATDADGQVNASLAEGIERELKRRSALSNKLDFWEPLGWAGLSGVLTAAAAVGIKKTTESHIARPALYALLGSTALNSAIQLVRIPIRYNAALRGGLDAAQAMHALEQEGPWASRAGHTDQSDCQR